MVKEKDESAKADKATKKIVKDTRAKGRKACAGKDFKESC